MIIVDNVIRLMAKPMPPAPTRRHSPSNSRRRPAPIQAEVGLHLLAARAGDNTETFLTLSAEQVLGKGGGPALPINDMLSDRVVLIGGNFSDRDQHLIPLSVWTAGAIRDSSSMHRSWRRSSTADPCRRSACRCRASYCAGRRDRLLGRPPADQIHLVTELVSVIALVAIGILAFIYASLIFPYTGVLLTWLAGVSAGYYSRPHH